MNLQVNVLGEFSLVVDGVPVVLESRKARALVAALALAGPLERGLIAEWLWGELGEGGARRNLRKTLYRLRATPLVQRLEVGGDLLSLPADRVDARHLEGLLAKAEYEQAAALGTGVLLSGLEFPEDGWTTWLEGWRAQVTGWQRLALLGWAGQCEARGDLRAALKAAQQALALNEFDEELTRLTMRLHLTLGERTDALRRYDHLTLLARDLGLAPEAATQALAQQARQEGEAPHHTPAHRAPQELRSAPLVGRERSWLRLSASDRAVLLLLGEPGVGKTRLASEFARAHGPLSIMRGREETAHTPFSPVAALLRGALQAGTWWPQTLDAVWRQEVGRLLPEVAPEALPTPAAESGRVRFLEGLLRAVQGAVGTGSLVLDDLHWFDEGTLELVSHLARRSPRLLATARTHELATVDVARRLLDGLRHDGLLDTLELDPLSEPEVLSLVQALSGAGGGVLFAQRLHRATRGNPLYLLELLGGLFEAGELRAEAGGWATPYDNATEDYAELPLPAGLRETVLARVQRLGQPAGHLLSAASLVGETFEEGWLAGLEPDPLSRLDALEGACQAGLLEVESPGFRFRHELLRRALDESLGQDRRRVLHAALAGQLRLTRAAPQRVADHLEKAGTPEAAVPFLEQAAEDAARVYAFRQALMYTEQALRHEPDDARRWYLERRRLWFLSLTVDPATYQTELGRFGQLAQRSGDPNRLAEVYFMRGLYFLLQGQPLKLAAEGQALMKLPHLSVTSRVNALYIEGHAQTLQGQLLLATEQFEEALRLRLTAEGVAASISAENIENGLTRVDLLCGAFERAAVRISSVLKRLEGGSDLSLIYTLNWQGHLATLQGRYADAQGAFGPAVRDAQQRQDLSALTWVLRHRATLWLTLGDAQAALQDMAEVQRLSAGRYGRIEAILGGLHAEALFLQGDLGEGLEVARAAIQALERAGVFPMDAALAELRGTLIRLLIECGDLTAAQDEINVAQALDDASDGLALRLTRTARHTAAARIALARGEHARALEWLQHTPALEHAPHPDRVAHASALARALTLSGEPQQALALLATLEPTPPLLPQVLRAKLDAHLALGKVPEDLLQHASGQLELQQAATTDRLDLMTSVMRGLEQAGQDAAAVRTLARATLAALLESLDSKPKWRSGLQRRFSPGREGPF